MDRCINYFFLCICDFYGTPNLDGKMKAIHLEGRYDGFATLYELSFMRFIARTLIEPLHSKATSLAITSRLLCGTTPFVKSLQQLPPLFRRQGSYNHAILFWCHYLHYIFETTGDQDFVAFTFFCYVIGSTFQCLDHSNLLGH